MNLFLALPAVFCGFALLALAMPRHAEDAWGREASRRLAATLRLAGAGLLIAGLYACIVLAGASVGAAAWCGLLGLGAVSVGLLLTYRARALPGIAAAALVLAAGLVPAMWP